MKEFTRTITTLAVDVEFYWCNRMIIKLPKWIYEIPFWFQIFIGIWVILDSAFQATSFNPFFARSGNLLASHVLTWTFIGIAVIWIRIKTKKGKLMDALQGFLAFFLAIGIGEGMFQLMNFTLFWHYLPSTIITNLIIFMSIFLAVILKTYKWIDKRRFLFFIVGFFLFMLGWRILGLPQSIILVGKVQQNTGNYYSYLVNSLELGQWFIAMFGFSWAYRGHEKR